MLRPVISLVCSCCGSETRGRQWWNADTGYGLCQSCANWIPEANVPVGELSQDYGRRGKHYDLPDYPDSDLR